MWIHRCVSVYTSGCDVFGGQHPLKLVLQVVMSCHVCAGTQTGDLEEQPVLLTTDTLFPPHFQNLK